MTEEQLKNLSLLLGTIAGPRPIVQETGGHWVAGPILIARLIGNAVWKIDQDHFHKSQMNLTLAYQEVDWCLIPTELQIIVDSKAREPLKRVVEIATEEGFSTERYLHELIQPSLFEYMLEDFQDHLRNAGRAGRFHPAGDWRRWMALELIRALFIA